MKVAEGPNTFNPADLNYWGKWQLITAKNWFAQSVGFRSQIKECDIKCQNSTILTDANKLEVPLVALTAMNLESNCQQRNLTGPACTEFEASTKASLELTADQGKLGSIGAVEYCPGICEHDMAWVKTDYIYDMILKHLNIMLD